jgi:hypothetical protein
LIGLGAAASFLLFTAGGLGPKTPVGGMAAIFVVFGRFSVGFGAVEIEMRAG